MTKIFRPNPKTSPRIPHDRGFSLLEILVVLAIMGLLLSVVSVRMFSMIESTQFIRQSEASLADLKRHRADALLGKHGIAVVSNPSDAQTITALPAQYIRVFKHPEGGVIEGAPVFITRGGVCRGGPITFSDGTNRKISYMLQPPNCRPERMIDPPN